MFRVTLACEGVPASAGYAAARDIQGEFAEHRQHHRNVVCTFTDGELVLTAENDFDAAGLALMDEFSDCISACIAELFDGRIRVVAAITTQEQRHDPRPAGRSHLLPLHPPL